MGILPSPGFHLAIPCTLSLMGFRPDVREPIPVTADEPSRLISAIVLCHAEGTIDLGECRGKFASKTWQ